jgi:hypothetical protein
MPIEGAMTGVSLTTGKSGPGRGRAEARPCACFAWLVASLLLAATPYSADAEQVRLAFVVANGKYANLGPLRNPGADGELIAASLRSAGFKVTLLTDLADEGFRSALRQIARESQHADSTLVYYAGHGVQVGGVNYLLPVDLPIPEQEDDIRLASVSADDVLSVIKSPYKVVVLDACRENPALGRALSRGRGASYKRGLAPVAPPSDSSGGIFIAYSTQSDAVALDGDGVNSPFAESFAKYLGSRLSIDDMFASVTRDVLHKTNGAQRPFKYASMDTVYCLPGACGASESLPVAQATVAAARALPMPVSALQEEFKLLSATRSPGARQKIEQQLWEALRATLPARLLYGVVTDTETQHHKIYAFHPASVSVDGRRIRVAVEPGEERDDALVFDGAELDEELLDCDSGEYTYTRTQRNTSVRLYSKAEQVAKRSKPAAGTIGESLLRFFCESPMRLTPVWAVDSLEWIPIGRSISVAPSIVYADPRAPDVRVALERFDRPKHDAFGATELEWIGVNCRTHEYQRVGYINIDASGTAVRESGSFEAWQAILATTPVANLYVMLCDK